MKVIIIGGHFTPALAIIEALPKDTDIVYFGREYTFEKDKTVSLEYQTVSQMGIPFVSITTGRVQRKFSRQTIPSLGKVPYGFFQAVSLLKKYKPDIIVGFGGYLSVPVCLAGKFSGIPVVIHEQTLEAGLANKIISHIAAKICISWKSSEQFFPKQKTILTGNPLPKSMFKNNVIASDSDAISSGLPRPLLQAQGPHNDGTICIIGGSAGSHAINVLIEGCLPELLERFAVVHQTGNAQEFQDYDRLEKLKETLPEKLQKRYTIIKYIQPEHFISVLQHADLVISRCGINTITTLLLVKKPSLLIPLPVSQRNEQYKNAQLLQQAGLAEILDQKELTAKKLFDKIVFMHNNKEIYENKIQKIKETIYSPLAAAEKIVTVLNDIYQENAKKKTESTA